VHARERADTCADVARALCVVRLRCEQPERVAVVARPRRGVERIRQQQARGLLNPHLDPGQLLISMLALTAYPIAFPQLARLATGLSVSDEKFQKQREAFLRQFALLLRGEKPGPQSL